MRGTLLRSDRSRVPLIHPAPRPPRWRAGRRAVLPAQGDVEDPVVAVVGGAVLVTAVAGGQPQAAVRGRLDRAQPAVRALEELLPVGQAAAADGEPVQPRAALGGDEQVVAHDGDAAARTAPDRVGGLRRDVATAATRGSLAGRPAIVAA